MLPWLLCPAWADQAPAAPPEEEAGEVVVVEAALPERPPESLRIDHADITRRGVTSVSEALSDDVAVHMRSGSRGEHLFTLHGFDQRQLAVFVDGVPATVPYDGQLDLGKLPASMVDEILISPGAAAGLFGPGGLGGAVRVRTFRPPPVPAARAQMAMSAQGGLEAFAWGGAPVGPLRIGLAAGGEHSPGWPLPRDWQPHEDEDGGLRDASQRRSQHLHGRAELDLGAAGSLRGGVNALDGSFHVPTGLDQDHPRYWIFSTYQDVGAHLGWASPTRGRLQGELTLFTGADRNVLDSFDDASRSSQDTFDGWRSTYRDHRLGGAGSLALRVAEGLTARSWLYADHQSHTAQSTVGEEWEQAGTTLGAGALALDLLRGPFRVFGGAELDVEVPAEEGQPFQAAPLSVSPSLGAGYDGEVLDLSAGVARRARAPTLKERFSSAMGDRLVNLELAPEHAWHASIDARWRPVKPLMLTLSVHDAEVDDLIEEVVLEPGLAQLQNVGRARFAGAEAGARLWHERAELGASAGLLHARRMDVEAPDDRLEYRPAWQGYLDGAVRPAPPLELWAALDLVGQQWFYDDDRLQWGSLGVGASVDAAVGWRPWRDVHLRLRARNLLDATLWSALGFPDPGRELRLEVTVEPPPG